MLFLFLKVRLSSYKTAINYLLSPFFCATDSFIADLLFLFCFVASFFEYNHLYTKYFQRYKKDENQ